jgi:PAS domain S-box-containing protein
MARDEDEERLLRSVALQNANSILVARQRAEQELVESKEALEQKTEELVQANRRLTLLTRAANTLLLANTPHEHLKTVFDAAAAEIGAGYYFHYQIDKDQPDFLTLRTSGGLDEARRRAFDRIAIGRSLGGEVALTRRSLAVENIHLRDDEATAALRALGVKAYVGLPLLAHGHLFGTIAFGSPYKNRFTESDIELLNTLTDQCAATLDRTRLLESLRESEARYRTALTAGRMGTWETDYVAGARIWSEEGMALYGLSLAEGRGRIGGDADEYVSALHPDDRHLAQHFHDLADKQDSFMAEYRVVRPDGSVIWLSGRGQVAARGADGKAQRLVSVMMDITERKEAEEHIQFLMREMSHRSKNLLSVIQAIAGQTVRSAGTIEEFETRFNRRLHGLAASHDVLVDQSWQGAPLAELMRLQLAPFVETDSSRLELTGPHVLVTAQAAQAIGVAVHELATNAAKYGALSRSTGTVKISWTFDDEGAEPRLLRLNWTEHGGPPVTVPSSKGFGHVVIERMVANSLDGEVAIDYATQGLRWTLSIPAANVVSGARADLSPKHGFSIGGKRERLDFRFRSATGGERPVADKGRKED